MKITLISSLYGISGGGAGVIVEKLASGLIAEGHTVSVVTTGRSSYPLAVEQSGIKIYSFFPYNLYALQEKDLHPAWQRVAWQIIDIYNPFVIKNLLKIFRHENPDVIHIHKMRGFSGAVWPTAANYASGRVVQTCHDYESISPQGLLQGRVGKMAEDGIGFMHLYQSIRKSLTDEISVVTAPSQYTLRKILSHGLFSSSRSFLTPNTHGYSLKKLKSLRVRLSKQSYHTGMVNLLYLGRLEPEKGVRELCKVFSEASLKISNLRLTIAGWGTLANELVKNYGQQPFIKFAGRIQGKVKEQFLADSDVIILPSTVPEVFGLVIVESFAFGKPVIISNIGGMPELVRGETGWLIEPRNSDVLRELFYKLGNNPDIPRKMSSACFEEAEKFALDTIVNLYVKIYEGLRI